MKLSLGLFKKYCLSCGNVGDYMCPKCLSKTQKPSYFCAVCQKSSIGGYTHSQCKDKYSIDRLIIVWRLDGVLKKAIYALKYEYCHKVALTISKYMSLEKLSLLDKNYVVTSIPLHWYKKNYRGFNQSEEIAKEFSKISNYKYQELLVCENYVKQQAKLNKKQRVVNIHQFKVIKGATIPSKIILIDDVWTTGTTINSAVKELKRWGASEVVALVVATTKNI